MEGARIVHQEQLPHRLPGPVADLTALTEELTGSVVDGLQSAPGDQFWSSRDAPELEGADPSKLQQLTGTLA